MLYYCLLLFVFAAVAVFAARLISKRLAKICAIIGFPVLIYATMIEPRWWKVTYLDIEISGLSQPMKAVLIGDLQPTTLHFSKTSQQAIIDRASAEAPDIVFWVGDYAYQPSLFKRYPWLPDLTFFEPKTTIDAMASLKAPMGSYAVLGNHDWWWNGPEVIRLLEKTDITVLLDRAVLAQHPRKDLSLWVAGMEDLFTPRKTDPAAVIAQTDGAGPVIALTHSPDVLKYMPESVAYTLSGHSHCGQIGIPWLQQRAAPIANKAYVCGFASGPMGQKMYVTSGIGIGGLPIRFLARPEIVVIRFKPA